MARVLLKSTESFYSVGWSILLCVLPLSNQQVSVFVHLQCPKSPGSHPQPTLPNQSILSPSTHPRRRASRLNSSRLLESYMASGPFDRLISRSSNDRSVSGNSSALSGQRDSFMKTFTYVSVLWKSKTSMCRQSDADQRHSCKHLLGHELSDVIGKQGRVLLLLVWWSVNRQILMKQRECQLNPVSNNNFHIINHRITSGNAMQDFP